MARILFVTWDGGGNVPPALGIAAELARRGDSVRFLGHPQQRRQIEAAGFRFEPCSTARPWSATARTGPAGYLRMFTDPGPGRDLAAAVAREPADLVVIDCLSFAALRTAQEMGLRHVVLAHTFHGYLTRSWSRGPLALVAGLKGYHPPRLWASAEEVLVTSLPELDPGRERPQPPNVHYTGPVLPAAARPASPEGQRILVSLSTIHYPAQARALQAILDAVADLPVHAVVATGHAVEPETLRPPRNAELHRYRPHAEVMPGVSLVVGHGGHGTTMQALAHDLPLVVMPMHPMLDQPVIGRVVEEHGAARVVRRNASPERIRTAIGELLTSESHRRAAAGLGSRIRAGSGAAAAADRIGALAAAPV
ncbi:glycosyltransferase [Streptomyces sp. NPDC058691]|uniref:glycosyltransferase n=1 Tax=Streptomyces sp. NPDC058691 TaxID=3346601 RepID=UPI00365A3999